MFARSIAFTFSMPDQIPAAGIREWLSLLLGRKLGVRIEGDSMSPALQPGDHVLVDPGRCVREGDIVYARHPFRSNVNIIKRVAHIDPDGSLILIGDNQSQSSDSRVFGRVPPTAFLGKIVAKIGQ